MTAATAPEAGETPDQNTGYGTKGYRTYVLSALTLIYIMNFVDRGLLAVVGPELVPELGLSDTQFGLLTGFGFALLYTIVGLPLARYADAAHRVWIMTICVALWSLMTVLCGLATEITIGSVTIGAFWVLLVCRVGVGIGEAGCTPPANSLIADYYAPRDRSQALGVYAMGVTLGTMFANLIGGWVTDVFDWRTAFYVVGLPGVLIAVVFKLTVKEPPRGFTDPKGTQSADRVSLREAIQELLTKPAFWLMTGGATVAAFCGYGISSFQSIFLVRTHEITTGEAAIWINTPVSLSAAIGTFATGWLATRLYKKYPGAIAWVPASQTARLDGYSSAGVSGRRPWRQAGVGKDAETHPRCSSDRGVAQLVPHASSRPGRPGRSSSQRPWSARQAQSWQKRKERSPRLLCAYGSASRAASSSGSVAGMAHTAAGWGSLHSAGLLKQGSAMPEPCNP